MTKERESIARFYRLKDLIDVLRIKRTKIYSLVKEGSLPRPLKIGRASVWKAKDVNDFINKIEGNRI